MILLVDNYDSFTFNIYDYLRRLGASVIVVKNDQYGTDQLRTMDFDKIILSPGPGNPDSAGICLDIMSTFCHDFPILGICLGHQVIAQYFGCKIIQAPAPMHGKIDVIKHDGKGLFTNIKSLLSVVRYHSLIVESPIPAGSELGITAENKDGIVMGLRHNYLPIESVQFHPEAIKTEAGLALFSNFLIN